jgi:hypothetical protein
VKWLCETRPPEWWETGDPGNRLAMLLCGVCPARQRCADTSTGEYGVVRAGVAYLDCGRVAPICHCGRPIATYRGRTLSGCCATCRVPTLRAWRQDRRKYWAEYYRQRKAKGLVA